MSFKIIRNAVGLLQANCYIIYDDKTLDASVIDPGGSAGVIANSINKHKLYVRCIFHTHGHMDHVAATAKIQKITRAPVFAHALDQRQGPVHRLFGARAKDMQEVVDGELIDLSGQALQIIHTPGHSPGSICIWARKEKVLFSGDLLFQGNIGRFDLKGGSFRELVKSLNERLAIVPDNTTVCPGHGPKTTMAEERKNNQFFKSARRSVVKDRED